MSHRAWAYIWVVLLTAAVLSALAIPGLVQSESQWLTFGVLTFLAILAHLLEAEAPGHQSYYPTMIFLFAGVVLLHPALFVLLVTLPHLLEWAKARLTGSPRLRDWYLQPFNIATHIICGFAAYWMYSAFGTYATIFGDLTSLVAGTTAALVYLLLNHLIVGQAVVLARGLSWRDTGVLESENLLSDFVMLILGFTTAMLWKLNPWLIVPALFPLLLMYRALTVPKLKKEARTDEKTGLWNARHFTELAAKEIERAKRFDRPAALVLADLDLLRDINNTYGHLAGDRVLESLGQIIRERIREYDIAGRFGGEEFCILMPETQPADGKSFAERLRKALENTSIKVATSNTPIRATMSLGVACFPSDGTTAEELIQRADLAMYQAKLKGRNCVMFASAVPYSARAERPRPVDQMPLTGATVRTAAFESELSGVSVGQDAPPKGRAVESEERVSPERRVGTRPKAFLLFFVGAVIAAAIAVTTLGSVYNPGLDLVAIVLFTALTLPAEVFEVNVYGRITMSISVAVIFAAALVSGLPGVACVSGAVAIVHWFRIRPGLYQAAFNWATHVLAGLAPVLAFAMAGIPLEVPSLLLLLIPAGLAALAYYAIETGLIAAAISLSEGINVTKVWGEHFWWLAPHYIVLCLIGLLMGVAYVVMGLLGVFVFVAPVLMIHYTQKQYVQRTEQSVRELRRMNEELALANREISSASEAIQQLNDELLLSFGKIIEARDPFVSGHSAKVADYATAIASELGLRPDSVQDLRRAAFLHDIGKIGVSERVLSKRGRLTTEDRKDLERHVTLGVEVLETCQGLRHLTPIIRHHHERWDGSGYPGGLEGDQIPLGARILAVCDAAEAMASDRPYRRARSLNEIVAEIEDSAGRQFDPEVAGAFVRIATRFGESFVINSAEHSARERADERDDVPQVLEADRAYLTY
jgi:diguanylate cyclase (GGDEF)-like protein/putative nucleotidyltransferase with HDIG domain